MMNCSHLLNRIFHPFGCTRYPLGNPELKIFVLAFTMTDHFCDGDRPSDPDQANK